MQGNSQSFKSENENSVTSEEVSVKSTRKSRNTNVANVWSTDEPKG